MTSEEIISDLKQTYIVDVMKLLFKELANYDNINSQIYTEYVAQPHL